MQAIRNSPVGRAIEQTVDTLTDKSNLPEKTQVVLAEKTQSAALNPASAYAILKYDEVLLYLKQFNEVYPSAYNVTARDMYFFKYVYGQAQRNLKLKGVTQKKKKDLETEMGKVDNITQIAGNESIESDTSVLPTEAELPTEDELPQLPSGRESMGASAFNTSDVMSLPDDIGSPAGKVDKRLQYSPAVGDGGVEESKDNDELDEPVDNIDSAAVAENVAAMPATLTTTAATQTEKDQDLGLTKDVAVQSIEPEESKEEREDTEQSAAQNATITGAPASMEQTPLDSKEAEALIADPYAHFEVSTEHSRLFRDKERGNLGAGTVGTGAVVDLWGCVPTMPRDDILPDGLTATLTIQPDGMVTESVGQQSNSQTDVYTESVLPFAKLGGELVWLPRHGDAARFFLTSEDYDALIEHVEEVDGKLQLKYEDQADITEMRTRVQKVHESIRHFCELGPLLPPSASAQQVYAEWLEMKQLSKALVKYNRQTTGMYMTEAMGMSGGIRKAVVDAVKQLFPDLKAPVQAVGAAAYSKRKASSLSEEVEDVQLPEFNPQLTMEPVDFKRQKFSIPFL